MKKTVLFISLLAFGFWGAAAWAQTPKLNTMTFRVDGQTKTCTTGEVTVSVTLVFNTTMRDSTPKIQFGLAAPSLPVPFKNKEWTNGHTTFVASFDINSEVPATADGLYKFLIRKAYSTSGDTIKPVLSDTVKNSFEPPQTATLYISRKGKLTINTNKLDFGTLKAGLSKDLSLNIKNVTCASISFTGFPVSGPFLLISQPTTLAPDANLTLTLRFRPTTRKTYADSLKIKYTSNQQQDSVIVKLAGIARGPEMAITPNPLPPFGTIDLGSSVSQKIYFTNHQAQPDTLSDSLKFRIKLNPATGYAVSKDSITIPPGKTDSIVVTFTPADGRTYTSSLDFITNDFNLNQSTGRFSLTLTGAGREKAPPPAFPTFTYAWPYGRAGYINSSTMTICLPITAEQASQIQHVRWKFTPTANDTPKAASDTTNLGGGSKLTFQNGCYYFTIPLAAKFVGYSWARLYWYLWFEGVNGTSSYNHRNLRYSSQLYYDVVAPAFSRVPYVTAGWTGNFAGYTNADNLTFCWEASDSSGLAEVRWKFTQTRVAPTNAADTTAGKGGTHKLSGNCVTIPLKTKITEGKWYCYLWLIDSSGNSSHLAANATEIRFNYDVTPPVAPSSPISRNIPANVWFGHPNNRTLTLTVNLFNGGRDAAAVRWKFKTPPTLTSSPDGTSAFASRTSAAATFSVPFNSTAWCGEDSLYYWMADSAGNSRPINYAFAGYKFDICSPVITRWLASQALGTKHTEFVDTIKIADHNPVNWDSVLYRFGGARINQPPLRLEKVPTLQKLGDLFIQKFVVRIPPYGVTTRGLEYTIYAADSLKNRGAGPMAAFGNACEDDEGDYHSNSWLPVRVKTVGDGEFRIDRDGNPVAQPNGRDVANYSLFSVPFELDKGAPKDVLEDDLGPYDKKKWRFFEYRTGTTVEYNSTAPTIRPFMPGRAFFMIVGDPDKVIDSGAGKTVTTVKSDTLVLEDGWNLFGDPFNFPIHRDQLHLVNSSIPESPDMPLSILTYERRWSELNDIIEPWKGYAIYVKKRISTAPTLLVICPIATIPPISKTLAPAATSATTDWTIQISAKTGVALDSINYVGVRRAAAAEYDDFDRFEPPTIGEYVSVYVDNAGWSQNPMKYTADFRPLSEETYEWPLQVNSNTAHGEVTLEFKGMADLPAGYEAYLVDEAYGIARNLRRNPEYQFAAGANGIEKSLKLLVGKSETLQKYSQSVALVPKVFALSQNFPNPFAVKQGQTFTAIRYALPKSATVTVEVYNMLGQKVRTLVNGQAQAADYYLAAWDGRDEFGKEVTSGVYVYRLLADSNGERFTSTKKLLFVK